MTGNFLKITKCDIVKSEDFGDLFSGRLQILYELARKNFIKRRKFKTRKKWDCAVADGEALVYIHIWENIVELVVRATSSLFHISSLICHHSIKDSFFPAKYQYTFLSTMISYIYNRTNNCHLTYT